MWYLYALCSQSLVSDSCHQQAVADMACHNPFGMVMAGSRLHSGSRHDAVHVVAWAGACKLDESGA